MKTAYRRRTAMDTAAGNVVLLERKTSTVCFRVRGLLGQRSLATWIENWCRVHAGGTVRASAQTGVVRIDGRQADTESIWFAHLDRALAEFGGVASAPSIRVSGERTPPSRRAAERVRARLARKPGERAASSTRLAGRTQRRVERQTRSLAASGKEIANAHSMPLPRLLQALATSAEGLTSREAAARLARDGPNEIVDVVGRSDAEILLDQFKSVPVALLGASGGLALATRAFADAVAIGAVLAANSVLGFITERRAEQTVASLRRLAPRMATVLRSGQPHSIPAREVVIGDVLLLKPGEAVAADARVVESHRLATNEAPLTGESLPVRKGPMDTVRRDAPLGERSNMVYLGTVVSGGMGHAVVTGTAGQTALGRIRALAQTSDAPHTRLQTELDSLGKRLAVGASALCVGVFAVGLLRGRPMLPLLRTAVSLGVAAIPEGLPTVATSLLAATIRTLQKRHVYARRLDAVENLGAVDTICFDKTGTLTENRMHVAAITLGQRTYLLDNAHKALREALPDEWHLVSILCSDVEQGENGLQGSSTETALVELAIACGHEVEAMRKEHPLLAVKHRSEHHPYMVTLHASQRGTFVAVKGRPDDVLQRCETWYDGKPKKLTARMRQSLLALNDGLANEGHRVLALAYRRQEDQTLGETSGLTWLGLAGLADALRPDLPAMVRRFHAAGIRPIMITGDQVGTAQSVANAIGFGGPTAVVDAAALPESASKLTKVVERATGFARTSPSMKLEIVHALQKRRHVVAMTGDGINDGPALKTADVGVAMGVSGTDFAHAMSDLVLKDDHPAAILPAIEEGRTAYLNVKKSVRYLVATNMSELATMGIAVAAGLPDPLDPLALLWTNLATDIWPAIAIGLEPPASDVMTRPPIALAEGLLARAEWRRVTIDAALMAGSSLAGFAYGLLRYGPGPRASTLAFMSLTSSQLLYALSIRSDLPLASARLKANPLLKQAVVVSLGAQAGTVLLAPLRRLLRTTPLSLGDVVVVGALAVFPLVVRELLKRRAASRSDALPTDRSAR
jgi:Ca2+-transporting ATPase